jgi:hypothetical protein
MYKYEMYLIDYQTVELIIELAASVYLAAS